MRAEASGSLQSESPLRAALAWTVTSPELLDCLAGVDVDGVLTFSEQTFAADEQTARALQRCLTFSEEAHVETDSVAIESSFPLALDIPVLALPDARLLSGPEGGDRLGIADVVIYEDQDNDGAFDETPRGAGGFADVVKGTSRALDEDDTQESFIAYREGGLSPVWKIFRAIYGCADPAPGFSTVTIGLTADGDQYFCDVDDRAVPVQLSDDVAHLGCAPLGDSAEPVRADDVDGLPAGVTASCEEIDGYSDLVFTENADSVCPEVKTLTLVGCDTSSEAACRASFFDLRGDEPSWWPCTFSDTVVGFEILPGAALSDGPDTLFSLSMFNGLAQLDIGGLGVEIDLPDGSTSVAFDVIVDDNDENGVVNVGDRVTVRERSDLFNDDSVAGYYPVRLVDGDGALVFATGYAPPVAIPAAPRLTFVGQDAAGRVTDGVDDLFLNTWTDGDGGRYDIAEVFVSGYLGGELPLGGSGGHLVLQDDVDGDGLFGRGDTLLVRESAETAFATPESLQSFGASISASVQVPIGFNLNGYAGYAADFVIE